MFATCRSFDFNHVEWLIAAVVAATHNLVIWLDRVSEQCQFYLHVQVNNRLWAIVVQLVAHEHQYVVHENPRFFLNFKTTRLASQRSLLAI